ncbi:MAG TPA: alpha/beta hydrolase [Clostridiaceae bacterium]|nr:alpha/beta hydrolase [Clostridiaceae bacterium]
MGIIFCVAAFIVLATASACAFIFISRSINHKWFDSPPSEGKFADSNGKKLFYRVKGQGGAVVVVLGAIGGSQAEWWYIQNEIGQKCRIITFDRPGFDWSKSEEIDVKSFDAVSEEIKLILKFEKVRKPVYLVAYGTGAFYARHYAMSNPDKVLGILLVNPMPFRYAEWKEAVKNIDECPDLTETAKKRKKLASTGIYRLMPPFRGYKLDKRYKRHIIEHYSRTANYDAMINELEQIELALNESAACSSFPEIPVRILFPSSESLIRNWVRSGISEYSARQLQRVYEDLSKDLLKISPCTSSTEVMGSGEYIHLSKPEIVVQEIREMVSAKKRKK